jgi:hypothetical protein
LEIPDFGSGLKAEKSGTRSRKGISQVLLVLVPEETPEY